jgi:steroid 5-alpha reductase family enzyme
MSLHPLAWGLIATVGAMFAAWLASVPRRDVSIVDIFWGPNLLVAAIAYALSLPLDGPREWLVLCMVGAWALRLSGFIAARNHGKPEDRRYRAMREKRGDAFWWKSFYIVFLTQALIAWVLSWQLYGAMAGTAALAWLDGLGVALWLFGFVFETVADRQLARFLARPDRGDAVMDQGLWRYSRHPNYFGEFCLWWGLYLLALSAGAWWAIIAPLMLSFLLLKVSGVALTEKDIADRRPAYRDYIERTSGFFPLPPRS